jgi:hypothetical protein
VQEGDTGTKTYQVPVRITGRGGGQVLLFLVDTGTYETTSWLATVRPGDRAIKVPVRITGDTLWGEGEGNHLLAKSERGLVIGDYIGGVQVLDDDPRPTVTVIPTAGRVAEGGTLSWTLTLSAPAETYFWADGYPQPPAGGAELSSTDVDPQWFRDYTGEEPEPSRPLSQTSVGLYPFFSPGETVTEVSVPTVVDAVSEPEETVEFHFADEFGLGPVIGTVY